MECYKLLKGVHTAAVSQAGRREATLPAVCKVQQCRAGLQGFVRQHLPLWHTLLREGDADWTPVLSPGLPAAISLETPNWSLVYLWYLYGPFMGLFFFSKRRMRGTDNWSWGSTETQACRSLLNLQFNKEILHLFALTRWYKSQLSGLNREMAVLHGKKKCKTHQIVVTIHW